jgi:hypothetical protein
MIIAADIMQAKRAGIHYLFECLVKKQRVKMEVCCGESSITGREVF